MLCYGFKYILPHDYYNWKLRYDIQESTLLDELEIKEKREKIVSELENNITIIGVSGIRDKLQEKVPETIADLRTSNIKVWMLTGDKFETAKKIAESAKLISKDTEFKSIYSIDENEIEY